MTSANNKHPSSSVNTTFILPSSQEAEKCGVTPEEVYAAILCSGSSTKPCDWLTSELPHLLDEICAMAASVQLSCKAGDSGIQSEVERDGEEAEQSGPHVTGGVKLSRAEAKLAWLAADGDTDRAVRQLLRDRQLKVGACQTRSQRRGGATGSRPSCERGHDLPLCLRR